MQKDLNEYLRDAEKTIFYTSYSKFLDRSKYEGLIKKEYFTFKSINIENFERMFVIHCCDDSSLVELCKIVNAISNKYFRVGKSPHPYICFINLDVNILAELKRDLVDQEIMFNDGTFFNGDRCRLQKIIKKELGNDGYKVKIISRENISEVMAKINFHQLFQFYLETPFDLVTERDHVKIQIADAKQILRML